MKFNEFATIYMKTHAAARKTSWKEDEGRLRNYILPKLGHIELEGITSGDVAFLHAEVGAKYPYQANRIKEQLSKMFNLAITWGFLDERHTNPTKRVGDFPETSRMRFATEHEAKRLISGVMREDDIYVRGAILLLLLTGLRKREILSMEWDKLDWAQGQLRVVKTKNYEVTFQPLNKEAMTIISGLPREPGNPYVIIGRLPGKHRNDVKDAWNRIKKRAGVDDVRLHDLRRTVGAWLTQSGVPIQIVKEVMNHKDIKTTLVYARVASKTKREALALQGELVSRLYSA
jgi:integrase